LFQARQKHVEIQKSILKFISHKRQPRDDKNNHKV